MAKKREEFLAAQISVEDNASKQLEKITKNIQKQNNELLRMKASMDRLRNSSRRRTSIQVDTRQAVKEVDRLDRMFKNVQKSAITTKNILNNFGKGVGRLIPRLPSIGLGGTLGVIGGGYAAKQAFENTFLQAANYEMSQKTIQAMFNDKNKSALYMKEMEKTAISSPLLNSQDIFGNSKSFIALTKSQEQLSKMWDLSERLLAVDPAQGVEGAVFALRELFSGDSRSMAERFELSKKVLNDIKNLPIEQQLKELDKYFNKLGMTKKLVNEMGDTTLGVWNQIKEASQVGLRRIGDPAVKIVKPLLDEINSAMQNNKQNRFVEFGIDMAEGIAEGFVKSTKNVGGWIDGIINNPEFQKAKNVEGKVTFVIEDLYSRFQGWFEKAGKTQIENVVTTIASTISTLIVKNSDIVAGAALQMGVSVGRSLASGIGQAISESPLAKAIIGMVVGGTVGSAVPGIGTVLGGAVGAGAALGGHYLDKITPDVKIPKKSSSVKSTNSPSRKSLGNAGMGGYRARAFGIQRVPYNNYPALLHEGERVQTKQQANQAERKQSPQVLITGNKFNVREEADIHKIAAALVREIEKNRVNFGGAM